jgi:hypothetical protein
MISQYSVDQLVKLLAFNLSYNIQYLSFVVTRSCYMFQAPIPVAARSNVTAYRNAVTLQVPDTIRIYDQNFLSRASWCKII